MAESGDVFERVDGSGNTCDVVVWEPLDTSMWDTLWRTSLPGEVAKIYSDKYISRQRKKLPQILSLPIYQNDNAADFSVAWPIALVRVPDNQIIGVMEAPHGSRTHLPVIFYNQSLRRLAKSNADWFVMHLLSLRVAKACALFHKNGIVLGDLNPEAISIKSDLSVEIINPDRFQYRDGATGEVFASLTGTVDYSPRELITGLAGTIDGIDIDQWEAIYLTSDQAPSPLRVEEHDCFALAVMAFQFLTGQHPFSGGRYRGLGAPPHETVQRIRRGHWLYGAHGLYAPIETDIPFEVMHPSLQLLFRRCFDDGHTSPSARPTALEWVEALEEATSALIWCSDEETHVYSGHAKTCSWCALKRSTGRDRWPTYKKGASRSFELAKSRLKAAHRNGDYQHVLTAMKYNPRLRQERDLATIIAEVERTKQMARGAHAPLARSPAFAPIEEVRKSAKTAAVPAPRRLFISYARSASEAMAQRLHGDLVAGGAKPWLDRIDIPPGSNWPDEIEAAIKTCDVFLLLLTPEAKDSENVKDEWHHALGLKKRIVPIRIAPCELPWRLGRRQWIDFTTQEYQAALGQLVNLLNQTS